MAGGNKKFSRNNSNIELPQRGPGGAFFSLILNVFSLKNDTTHFSNVICIFFSYSGITHLLAWCQEIWYRLWSWTDHIVGCIMFLGDQRFGLPVDLVADRSSCIPHLQNHHDRRSQNKRRTSFQVGCFFLTIFLWIFLLTIWIFNLHFEVLKITHNVK